MPNILEDEILIEVINELQADRDFCDYPTAWAIQNRLGWSGFAHKSERCSAVQVHGAFLCDCGAVTDLWARGMKLTGHTNFKDYTLW